MTSDISELQKTCAEKPYSIKSRLQLAYGYQGHGYPDLAAGEAYLALLLVDECLGETGEFEDEALEATMEDYAAEGNELDEENGHDLVKAWTVNHLKEEVYITLITSLIECNSLKQAHQYIQQRSLSFKSSQDSERVKRKLQQALTDHVKERNPPVDPHDYPDWSRVRREVYPWNHHEPDRSSTESLDTLNGLLERTASRRLEARFTDLPDLIGDNTGFVRQIGLFAKEDIESGVEILSEKSVLTATARMDEPFCDACAARLPDLHPDAGPTPVSCPECTEIIFCSQDCLHEAQNLYHPALCGKDVNSLSKKSSAKEAPDALYSLLLLRVLALATQQDIHPLDLIQTKYLWGDMVSPRSTLPFNFYYNVVLPLLMLEKMEINPFETSRHFSPWVFNTLYAKFRGTADARQGPDGRPEVSAVHPLWCLANHSCDPNVKWEWEGSIKFWVRTEAERVDWRGRGAVTAGLKKGEQIFGHYCDVTLPVKERREWARGALGGDCVCDRCIWEVEQAKLSSGLEMMELSKK